MEITSAQTLVPPAGDTEVFFAFFLFQKKESGGDEENRTPDPLLARQVLSQLSYTPIFSTGLGSNSVSLFTILKVHLFRKLVPSKLNNDLLTILLT